jgi:hypothetical protein
MTQSEFQKNRADKRRKAMRINAKKARSTATKFKKEYPTLQPMQALVAAWVLGGHTDLPVSNIDIKAL